MAQQFQPNGFCYQLGGRDLKGDMEVLEGVAEGIGTTLLCGLRIRKKSTGELICDVPVPANTKYSRQTVVELVHQHLTGMLAAAAIQDGLAFDRIDVEEQVAAMLDECYFAESRRLALDWAISVGLIKKEV